MLDIDCETSGDKKTPAGVLALSDHPPLTLQDKVSYGVGQISESIKTYAFGLFILFYYTQLLGVSGSLTGLALLLALMSDAITDPMIGSLSDRWQSKWGRRHPFMYLSIIPLGLSFFLVFSPPGGLGEFGLFLWLTVTTIAARVSLTLFHVPHIAMGAELSNDYTERTEVVQFRYGLGVSGMFAVYALAFLVFFTGAEGQRDVGVYPAYGLTLALIMVVTMLWCTRGTQHLIPRMINPTIEGQTSLLGLLRDCATCMQNESFRWYFFGVLVLFVMVGIDSALALHVSTYVWQLEKSQLFYLTMAAAVGYGFGATLTRFLHLRFEKRTIVMFGAGCWAAGQIIPIMLFLIGWFPAPGSTAILVTLAVMRFFQYAGTMQALITSHSMMGDVADEHELKTGKRQEGVFFGTLSFSGKATTGLGNFIAGVALDLIAWPKGENILPADVPTDKITWLALLYGPIVAGFSVIAQVFYYRYKIDRVRHREVLEQLSLRRGREASHDEGLNAAGAVPAPAFRGSPAE